MALNETPWPAQDIETLGACPLCGGGQRHLLHENLADRIFFTAPGRWQLWGCDTCGAGYLDPRPTPGSISRAYAVYYTHNQTLAPQSAQPSREARLKQAMLNDFLNARFSYHIRPALPLGRLAFALRPDKTRDAAAMVRHLPAPRPGEILLDIGCGNGAFMLLARDRLGYEVQGTELDETAAARARAQGLVVHNKPLPGMSLPPSHFAHVTLNHVLEHLHNPLAALREIYNILSPGGRVWVQVPNLLGASHEQFGPDCRLLEPPRHLVMFTPDALRATLQQAGFTGIEWHSLENSAVSSFTASWKIAARLPPAATNTPPVEILAAGAQASRRHNGISEHSEFITMTASRATNV